MMIDYNLRYQTGLTLNYLFPKIDSFCACGCGKQLSGKKSKWYSDACRTSSYIKFAIVKGDNRIIRQEVFKRDQGFCRNCGVLDKNWQADHIQEVYRGGAACSIDNLQTLCLDCHKEKTYNLSHHKAISSQADSTLFILKAYALGEDSNVPLKTSKDKHIFKLGSCVPIAI